MAHPDPLLARFSGPVIPRGDPAHTLHRYQYAYTSVDGDRRLDPACILMPTGTDDVLRALEYAEKRGVGVAVRTGGHQLSGASSTAGDNLLLDLRHTWRDLAWHADSGLLRAGVSHTLRDLHHHLRERGLFLPHGQCSHVMLGGHVQTGGSGMLARAFGLMSDHVASFEIVLANGTIRTVRRDATDPDEANLYFAVLGGCPGNFGVLTHATFRPLRDRDHPEARGLKFVAPYDRDRLRRLLDVLVDLPRDDGLAADHDVTVSVLGSSQWSPPWARHAGRDEQMRARHPEIYGRDGHRALPRCIAVYAQWSNLGGPGQPVDRTLFDRLREAAGPPSRGEGATWRSLLEWVKNHTRLDGSPLGLDGARPTPISALNQAWMFLNVREFCLPFVKRTFVSDRTDLATTGWAGAVVDHLDALIREGQGLKGMFQVQHQGGRHSRYRTGGAGAGHPWRADTSLVCLADVFYPEDPSGDGRARAEAWQVENDRIFLGEQRFARTDRRFWWGSYGDLDLRRMWPRYVQDAATWDRLRQIKAKVDPHGRFSASPLSIPPD